MPWRKLLQPLSPVGALGSLICCVLPITLVSLGLGTVMASLVTTAPWLVTISRYKLWVFLGVGLILATNYWILYRSEAQACESDAQCHPSKPLGRWTRRVYWSSVALYGLGVGAAYLSVPIVRFLDNI